MSKKGVILVKKNGIEFVKKTSGSLHDMVYEMFVLANANRMVKECGIDKDEAIRRIKEAVPSSSYVVGINPDYA